MDTIQLEDKVFKKSIESSQIQEQIQRIAHEINSCKFSHDVIFIAVLNGAFMFATDVVRRINFPCRISFLKLASYLGSSSTGAVKQLVGINEELKNKSIIVLEDIVDTGHTLDTVLKQLKSFDPAEIKIASLLYKPDACKHDFKIDHVGFTIPNDFIVGFGLDYNGLGRNLDDIYTIVK